MTSLFRPPLTRSTLNSPTRFGLTPRRIMSSSPTQRLFQLKLDPLTGNSEWVVIDEQDQGPENPSEPLLATTSYLDMLNDARRNRAFREAIDKTVTRNCRVLDIGAGTGLLSMMAARAMSSGDSEVSPGVEGMVTACESYLPMVKLMRKVLHLNGMGRKINVINKRSDELIIGVDISSRADVLENSTKGMKLAWLLIPSLQQRLGCSDCFCFDLVVSEILDSELLGEGLIPTLQHAHDKLLVEKAKTVPYRATTYAQLVESKFLWKLHDLYNNEVKALDNIYLVPSGQETILSIKQQQYAMHCDAIKEEIKLLSEPFKIFEFDFSKRPDSHEETELRIKTTDNGSVHAVISWWILQLDCEGTIFYSTAPKWISVPFNVNKSQTPFSSARDWCDHWKQCVWFIPGKGVRVSKDEEVHLHAIHTDISISYNLKTQLPRTQIEQCDLLAKDSQLILSPERVAIYGDSEWRFSMLTAVKNALLGKAPSLCVVADDSIFLTILIAHLMQTSHVISLFPGLRDNGTQYLQSVADANGFSMDRVEVLQNWKTCLTMLDARQKKVDLLIGEPFYHVNEGKLPWQNLRFWKERTMLNSVLSEDVIIMPCKGILRACAMSLPDLWNSRRCLNKIEGLDHSVVNATLGACGDLPGAQGGPCLPFFVWQCGEIKELSAILRVMEFDFSKPISPCIGKAKVEFIETGICHGFVLWIDWVMDAANSTVLATGPVHRYWKQGVKLLSKPISVGLHGSERITEIEASFDPSSGELIVKILDYS